MIKIVYISLTGNTQTFVDRLGFPSLNLNDNTVYTEVNNPYIIIAPTYDKEVTDIFNEFLEIGNNKQYCKGVVGCGNINFAELYCFTAKDLNRDYNIPLLHMMEYFGNDNDLKKIKGVVESLGTA
jgi:nrdI protein